MSLSPFNDSISSQSSDLDPENNESNMDIDQIAEVDNNQENNALMGDNLSKKSQNYPSSTELSIIQENNALMSDNIPKTSQNCFFSKKQGNCIPNPQNNERSNKNESSRRNSRCLNTSSINLNENIEQSTRNKQSIDHDTLKDILQKLVSEIHRIEQSCSVSSEDSSVKTKNCLDSDN